MCRVFLRMLLFLVSDVHENGHLFTVPTVKIPYELSTAIKNLRETVTHIMQEEIIHWTSQIEEIKTWQPQHTHVSLLTAFFFRISDVPLESHQWMIRHTLPVESIHRGKVCEVNEKLMYSNEYKGILMKQFCKYMQINSLQKLTL